MKKEETRERENVKERNYRMQNDEYKDPFAPDDENAGAGEPPPNQSRWDDVPDPFEDAEPKRRSYGENGQQIGRKLPCKK